MWLKEKSGDVVKHESRYVALSGSKYSLTLPVQRPCVDLQGKPILDSKGNATKEFAVATGIVELDVPLEQLMDWAIRYQSANGSLKKYILNNDADRNGEIELPGRISEIIRLTELAAKRVPVDLDAMVIRKAMGFGVRVEVSDHMKALFVQFNAALEGDDLETALSLRKQIKGLVAIDVAPETATTPVAEIIKSA